MTRAPAVLFIAVCCPAAALAMDPLQLGPDRALPTFGTCRELASFEGVEQHLSADCMLSTFSTCSGWMWLYCDAPGAVWGTVYDPRDCPGGCTNGGAVSEVYFYARCGSSPARIGDLRITAIDAAACPTELFFSSGPLTLVNCTSADHWQTYYPPSPPHVLGNPFAVMLEFDPRPPVGEPVRLGGENSLGNLFCARGLCCGFPGCASQADDCGDWVMPPQASYIWVTDTNGDGTLEDLCALYGHPAPLGSDTSYGFLPENLFMEVGLDCSSPVSVEGTSWGRVKALFR